MTAVEPRTRLLGRYSRIIRFAAITVAALVVSLVAAAWWFLDESLPLLTGSRNVAALSATVKIERDVSGVPTIAAASRADVAVGMGWVQAQDRFFQMDLLRRAAAGELSALFGSAALEADKKVRPHRFRHVAQQVLERLPPSEREVLDQYTAGVNAGLSALSTRPFEYGLLQARPQPWRPEDCVLVVLAMFLQLEEPDGHYDLQRGLLTAHVSPVIYDLLYSNSQEWQATLDGSRGSEPTLPTAEQLDLRKLTYAEVLNTPPTAPHSAASAGSNNWAVGGHWTANGAAMVANDMHLDLSVPNIWYRVRLVASDASIDVMGITIPGAPSVVAGSNRHIAWGFTNTWGDFSDVIVVVTDPSRADHYLTASGSLPFGRTEETIEVRGGQPVSLPVLETRWGPVVGYDSNHRPLALAWTAHDPDATNFNILDLERATSVQEALKNAAYMGIPPLNLVVGDTHGDVGWTVMGRIPVHLTADPARPSLSTAPQVGFGGWLTEGQQPHILGNPESKLWTANARVVGGRPSALIGDGGLDRGTRAHQIQSDLEALRRPLQPRDFLAIQLDDRAIFLEHWRQLLRSLLDPAALTDKPSRIELKSVLESWSGHAGVNDTAYALVRQFRQTVERSAFDMLVAPAHSADPTFRFTIPPNFEGVLWKLVTAQPPNLLVAKYSNWREFLLAAADSSATALTAQCGSVSHCTWGHHNIVRILHPLADEIPLVGSLLNMTPVELPGDDDMPRVQGQDFGASERFAVAPGHEAEGYFEMPAGQSGHPLSPFYRAGHENWVNGTTASFLPGPTVYTLTLLPQTRAASATAKARLGDAR